MANVFFELEVGGNPGGKIVFRLFDDICPKTAANFRGLCTGEKGYGYKGSSFHKIVSSFMIQGGDFVNHNGTGGKSIWGEKFADESFAKKHLTPYLLSMWNSGPNTNTSQFFITFSACPWFDGKNVVFGEVVEGKDVVDKIHKLGSSTGKPQNTVKIIDCGVVAPPQQQTAEPEPTEPVPQ